MGVSTGGSHLPCLHTNLLKHYEFVLGSLEFVLEHNYFLLPPSPGGQRWGRFMPHHLRISSWTGGGDIFCKDLILYSQHIFGHNIWILLDSTRALFVDSVQILNQETFGLKFTFELNKRKSFLGVD